MKHVLFIIILLNFVPTISWTQTEVKDEKMDEFGTLFLVALQSKDINKMLELKPSPKIWRAALPNETKSLSDDQLLNDINKSEKFVSDFNNIIESAEKTKINLDEFEYIGALYGKIEAGKMIGISLKYSYKQNEINIPVSLLRHDSKFYLSEILLSYDIFSRNNLGK
ncbi:MAG: hypothetical protein HOG05_11440 [Bacteroidetes bacterium]|nr:hypothetical protein [Bacteroidota bacterium]MBT5529056.1 hypothetical protein [Cytophagia bacterium]MBT3423034.1 hypothetical protein [Bacteroidota bacterium]MBT3801754.1 hypothetical protein [Bacteroidota bacterium]MBT3934759.1 hypothetical protein [Bacteroidota bacterium]